MCPMEPGNEEQMSDRHAVASGEDESQHDENRRGGTDGTLMERTSVCCRRPETDEFIQLTPRGALMRRAATRRRFFRTWNS